MRAILGLWTGIDAGACVVVDGIPVCGISEERLSRVKHASGIPVRAIDYVLGGSGVAAHAVEAVVVTNRTPWLYFKRMMLLNTRSAARDYVIKRFFRKQKIAGRFYGAGTYVGRTASALSLREVLEHIGIHAPLCTYDHHHAHAMYGYFLSGFDRAISISLDGDGNGLSGMVANIADGKMCVVQENGIHGASLGCFYGCVTEALGFKVKDGEGKTMGLASFGSIHPQLIREFSVLAPRIRNRKLYSRQYWEVISATDEHGAPRDYFRDSSYVRALIHKYGKENVAAAAQHILEEVSTAWILGLLTPKQFSRNLVLTGGVALNVSNTHRIWSTGKFDSIFVPPAPGDVGHPMGLALLHADRLGHRVHGELPRLYYGRRYSDDDIRNAHTAFANSIVLERLEDVAKETASFIAHQSIVGWFQGGSEWGNRALGARSVLADPRRVESKERINTHLKQRDWFMPFAPSVLAEHCADVFEQYGDSRFMNHKFIVRSSWREKIPAVVHVDGSARPQGVRKADHPLYHAMIQQFHAMTGIPLVLNTSFNKHGLPIVETPRDAFEHLEWGCVDALVIESFIARRRGA